MLLVFYYITFPFFKQEKEVDIQLTDFSGEIDADMVSYAIGLLIEANGVY